MRIHFDDDDDDDDSLKRGLTQWKFEQGVIQCLSCKNY